MTVQRGGGGSAGAAAASLSEFRSPLLLAADNPAYGLATPPPTAPSSALPRRADAALRAGAGPNGFTAFPPAGAVLEYGPGMRNFTPPPLSPQADTDAPTPRAGWSGSGGRSSLSGRGQPGEASPVPTELKEEPREETPVEALAAAPQQRSSSVATSRAQPQLAPPAMRCLTAEAPAGDSPSAFPAARSGPRQPPPHTLSAVAASPPFAPQPSSTGATALEAEVPCLDLAEPPAQAHVQPAAFSAPSSPIRGRQPPQLGPVPARTAELTKTAPSETALSSLHAPRRPPQLLPTPTAPTAASSPTSSPGPASPRVMNKPLATAGDGAEETATKLPLQLAAPPAWAMQHPAATGLSPTRRVLDPSRLPEHLRMSWD